MTLILKPKKAFVCGLHTFVIRGKVSGPMLSIMLMVGLRVRAMLGCDVNLACAHRCE